MITILKNDETGETAAIELTDVLKQPRIAQTFNDPLDYMIFLRRAAHRITCVAITPIDQPVADQAQSLVTTRTIEPEKVVEEKIRVPHQREDILAAFKAAGHEKNIPLHVRRGPLTQLHDVLGRAGSYLRRTLSVRQPT